MSKIFLSSFIGFTLGVLLAPWVFYILAILGIAALVFLVYKFKQ